MYYKFVSNQRPTITVALPRKHVTFGVRSDYRLTHATYITYENGDATDVGIRTGQPEKGGGQQGKQPRTMLEMIKSNQARMNTKMDAIRAETKAIHEWMMAKLNTHLERMMAHPGVTDTEPNP
jgi:hypothetical protein